MTPGYRIPIHRALTRPLLLAGVPRHFAILNGTLCFAFLFGLQVWYELPIALILHGLALYWTKKDPHFFNAFQRQLSQKSYYSV